MYYFCNPGSTKNAAAFAFFVSGGIIGIGPFRSSGRAYRGENFILEGSMNTLVFIIVILAILLGYFVAVVFLSRRSLEEHIRFRRKADVNREIITDFMEGVFNKKDAVTAEKYLSDGYIQHNPAVANGKQACISYVAEIHRLNPNRQVSLVRLISEGDFVAVHSHVILNAKNPDDRGAAAVNIFRLEGGRIMEHWGVAQPVPEKAENPNTMF